MDHGSALSNAAGRRTSKIDCASKTQAAEAPSCSIMANAAIPAHSREDLGSSRTVETRSSTSPEATALSDSVEPQSVNSANINVTQKAKTKTSDSGASAVGAAPNAAAAVFLQQYFAQPTIHSTDAENVQQNLWQMQQLLQQQPQHLQVMVTKTQQKQLQAPSAAIFQAPLVQQQPPSTVSLSSATAPGAAVAWNGGSSASNSGNYRKRKAEGGDNNILQFSDAASRSLKLDHSRSVVSSSSVTSLGDMGPPKEKTEAELYSMTPAQRRRYERNLREQQRSYRISQQIKSLRDVLSESGIPFKPNKFSILVSVAEYIKNLQQRSIMLDVEQKKLADTIRRTSEMVASGQVPSSDDERDQNGLPVGAAGSCYENGLFVPGLDYKSVFQHSPFASGVASLDGRILYANHGLEQCFGTKNLEQQSLFLYINNHQDVFEAMADILRRSSIACESGETSSEYQEALFWCGHIKTHKKIHAQLNITLTSAADGNPKYFCFSIAPVMI